MGMDSKDVRWKQRFQNFEKAIANLKHAVEMKDLSDLEKSGVIKTYEYTFELAWKTLKDYLEDSQVAVKFPRDTIKEGFSYGIIKNGDVWMDMLQQRNLMSHTYNEENAEIAYNLIVDKYYKEINEVYLTLKKEL